MASRIGSRTSILEVKSKQKIPQLGFAVCQVSGEEASNLVDLALEIGYRHIECAFAYNNETAIGKTLKAWLLSGRLQRDELFVTTKLPPNAMRKEDVKRYLVKSLLCLGLEYVDMYMIHLPIGTVAMEAVYDSGLAKSLGLCNFSIKQVQKILDCCRIRPSILQVECHIFLQQRNTLEFCRTRTMPVSALLPAAGSGLEIFDIESNSIPTKDGFAHALEADLAMQLLTKKYGKTSIQLMVKWLIQKGLHVSAKLVTTTQLFTAYKIFDFELSTEDIRIMDGLERHERFLIPLTFFPGVEQHPEYPFKP